ncbi:MAG: DUF5395 family protein [bacterium]
MRLIHDGSMWLAENGETRASGRTLAELDRELGKLLGRDHPEVSGSSIKVRMTFDNAVFPEWMRQYSNHYFNRVVTIKPA